MVLFLTASPFGPLDASRSVKGVDPENQLCIQLRRFWKEKEKKKGLLIPADPDRYEVNDLFRKDSIRHFAQDGFLLSCLDILDHRKKGGISREQIRSYDITVLGGGHVPTQNRYFSELGLRAAMDGYEGLVIGISAGSMNCADEVYAQPDRKGESSPDFCRFLTGLGLTTLQILPHYQILQHMELDGRQLIRDITSADSRGRSFLCLPDGSYVLSENGTETVFGDHCYIRDGRILPAGTENLKKPI